MRLSISYFIPGVLLFLGSVGIAHAAIANPYPGLFYDDDNTQYYVQASDLRPVVAIELLDPLNGDFGFWNIRGYKSFPKIFDVYDGPGSIALVDFATVGYIYDYDDAYMESYFTPNERILFYHKPGSNYADSFFPFIMTTNAVLNGYDRVSSFQFIADPTVSLLVFEHIFSSGPLPVAAYLVSGIVPEVLTPAAVVPEPASWLLMLGGLVMLLGLRSQNRV